MTVALSTVLLLGPAVSIRANETDRELPNDKSTASCDSFFFGLAPPSSTCSRGQEMTLKEFLQTSVFGQTTSGAVSGAGSPSNNGDSVENSGPNNSNKKSQETAWPGTFPSFLQEHREKRPILSFLEARFNKNQSESEGDTTDDLGGKPFFSFLEAIRQTKASILGIERPPNNDETKAPTLSNDQILSKVLEKARHLAQQDEEANAMTAAEFVSLMKTALQKVVQQLQDNFGTLLTNHLDAYIGLAIPYFAMFHDANHSPLIKRKLHRFYQTVTKDEWIDLHDALYLAQLAYVDTMEQFELGLEQFDHNAWTKLYGTTQSLPDLPASFLLIHKEIDPLESKQEEQPKTPLESIQETIKSKVGPSPRPKQSEVLVTLVVRGTKHMADFLQDGLLEPEAYRGGYAHGGILASGKNLAQKYLPKLKDLHQVAQRDKIQLVLIGHSLGAGVASIAAMELQEHDFLDVRVIGFGCPSLLSKDLSESTKDYITTVVNDADIVSRMSGASMTNILLDLMDYDWTQDALEDLGYSLERAKEVFPEVGRVLPDTQKTLEWFEHRLETVVRPNLLRKSIRERLPCVLIPPGTCIHLFRDGYGVTGTYTPCDFFDTVEFSLTLLDDHLILTGYNRALLAAAQDSDRDYSFRFAHDVNGIVGI